MGSIQGGDLISTGFLDTQMLFFLYVVCISFFPKKLPINVVISFPITVLRTLEVL